MEQQLIRKNNTETILGTARELLLLCFLLLSSKHWSIIGGVSVSASVLVLWAIRYCNYRLHERSKIWHYASLIALCFLLVCANAGNFDNRVDAGFRYITWHMLRASIALPVAVYVSGKCKNWVIEIAMYDVVFHVLCFAPTLFGLRMEWIHVLLAGTATAVADVVLCLIFEIFGYNLIDKIVDRG